MGGEHAELPGFPNTFSKRKDGTSLSQEIAAPMTLEEQAWRAICDAPCSRLSMCRQGVRWAQRSLALPASFLQEQSSLGNKPEGKSSRQNALCWKEIVHFFPPCSSKEGVCMFYFFKAMMLKLLQTRLCRTFQRGITAALGRLCQKTLDFEL